MSIYIPHVFTNITEDRIIRVFDSLSLGKVKNIDFVEKMSKYGTVYNAAYIHFEYWYNTDIASSFQERVRNPDKEARLVYDEPWYWIVLENHGAKSVPGARKLRVNLTDMTPVKKRIPVPSAPVKNELYNNRIPNLQSVKRKLDVEFDMAYDNNDKHEQMLDKLEAMMDEEDSHLISIDGRYVQSMENYINQLQYSGGEWATQAFNYFVNSGLNQATIADMRNEIASLKAQVVLLEDRQFDSMV
jgi:hypothetical protein